MEKSFCFLSRITPETTQVPQAFQGLWDDLREKVEASSLLWLAWRLGGLDVLGLGAGDLRC